MGTTGPHNPRGHSAHATLHDLQHLHTAEQPLLSAVRAAGFPEAAVFAIRLSLEEAVTNAFRHGSRGVANPVVRLGWTVGADRIELFVEDSGPGFNPGQVPDCTHPDRLEVPSGRGLMLMRAYMTSVEYNDKGNRVSMVYERPRA
ncbi:MAG: ATP-binding protein [Phycisphaerales bacterium]|nr:ATP-binding protein [Phycisphaerales bacterium]